MFTKKKSRIEQLKGFGFDTVIKISGGYRIVKKFIGNSDDKSLLLFLLTTKEAIERAGVSAIVKESCIEYDSVTRIITITALIKLGGRTIIGESR